MTRSRPEFASAGQLRREFDLGFAAAPGEVGEPEVGLLTLRVRGVACAVRLADLSGVVSTPQVISVPSDANGLLGLSGVRGRLVPVFDLGALLGHAPCEEPLRWLVMCGSGQGLALAVNDIEHHLSVPVSALRSSESSPSLEQLADQLVDSDSGLLPVINLARLLAALEERPARRSEAQPL